MDYIHCSIALGVDVLLLGLCYKDYSYFKKTCKTLRLAPTLTLEKGLKDHLGEKEKVYCAIRGTVQPMTITLRSSMVPSISGVLQVMKLKWVFKSNLILFSGPNFSIIPASTQWIVASAASGSSPTKTFTHPTTQFHSKSQMPRNRLRSATLYQLT